MITDIIILGATKKAKTEENVTKRTVLSKLAANFNHLGFISPAIVKAKDFFQRLCIRKLDWDEELSDEEIKEWIILNDWESADVEIPRKV